MLSIFLQLFARTIEYVISIPENFKNWYHVRIQHKHHRYVSHGMLNHNSKIAIMNIFPGTTPYESVARIVTSLQSEFFSVIMVINENSQSDSLFKQIQKLNTLILRRPNIGGDFGAYKSGFKYLQENNLLEQVKELIFINDSIYVTERTSKCISEVASSSNETNCLFYHRQRVGHAGSMYLKFTEQIIKNRKFQEFWENYYPYRNKRKIIRKGEHKLSEIIGREYFKPIVNANALISIQTKDFQSQEIFQILSWAQRTKQMNEVIKIAVENRDYQFIFNFAAFNFQVSNSLGLYVNRIFDVPLKMDLAKLGLTTPFEYLKIAKNDGCQDSEISSLEEILNKKGSYTESNLLKYLTE